MCAIVKLGLACFSPRFFSSTLTHFSAAEKLQATTYPFVAFLALQPRRNPGPLSSSSSPSRNALPPSLTVLSRHQGPSHPPDNAPTSAATLTAHLSNTLLPRVTPFLARLRQQQAAIELDRHLRSQQDAAFADSARRDKERIERKMAEERKEREEARRRKEEEEREKERARREEEQAKRREEERGEWRRWMRKRVVPASTNTGTDAGKTIRIAIRLPSGARIIHTFPSTSTLTTLYTLVDTQFIPPSLDPASDPISPPSPSKPIGTPEQLLEKHITSTISNTTQPFWHFRLATSYPRIEIPWTAQTKLSDVEQLKGGGQVVVELLNSGGRRSGESTRSRTSMDNQEATQDGDDDDEYDTEDSE